jgi:hypothetical protein
MAETRDLLQLLLHNKRHEVHPKLAETIEALLRSRLRRTAPLTELTEMQRIAWIDECTHLHCHTPLGTAFSAGQPYRVKCLDIPTATIVDRQTLAGTKEEVLVTGRELLITIIDNHKRTHGFSHTPIPGDITLHQLHHTETLVSYFTIPEARDITKIYPATYLKHIQTLSSL